MDRKIVIASHHAMAKGIEDTLKYLTHTDLDVCVLCAYMENKKIDSEVANVMSKFKKEDEVFIFTDIASGSVNQKFYKYINRPHTHIIAGMNLPIIMSVALNNSQEYFNEEAIEKLVNQAKDSLVYVNQSKKSLDKEDE